MQHHSTTTRSQGSTHRLIAALESFLDIPSNHRRIALEQQLSQYQLDRCPLEYKEYIKLLK